LFYRNPNPVQFQKYVNGLVLTNLNCFIPTVNDYRIAKKTVIVYKAINENNQKSTG
jgi:hypothetical protein